MKIIVETARLVIREFKQEEENLFLALFADEQVSANLTKRTRQEVEQMFLDALKDYETGTGLGYWGIFNKGDADFIGMCLLRNYHDEPGKTELGYVFNQKFWGRGIATEVAALMVNYAFEHTVTDQIVAVTTLQNRASQKVLAKAGLKQMSNIVKNGQELTFFRLERRI